MAILPGGRDAVTHYNVKERFRDFTRVQAQLETGRTHQIRVHFSYIGHGLAGDQVYMNRVRIPAGASELLIETLRGFKRQALHAAKLGLKHPRTGEEMLFEAPWPEDFTQLVNVYVQKTLHIKDWYMEFVRFTSRRIRRADTSSTPLALPTEQTELTGFNLALHVKDEAQVSSSIG